MDRPDETLLTVADVARQVQVAPETVQRWIREGRLVGIRLGGTKTGWRISQASLRKFLDERTTLGLDTPTNEE